MNKEVKEIKNDLDFARDLFDYTLNPNQCGLLLDYTNQLETSIATKDSELLQLKEELRQLKTNRDEAIKEIKKRSTPEVAQLYIEILEKV